VFVEGGRLCHGTMASPSLQSCSFWQTFNSGEMLLHVRFQVRLLCKSTSTRGALIRSHARVQALVLGEAVGLGEPASAHLAAELPRPAVDQPMPPEVSDAREVLPALVAVVPESVLVVGVNSQSLRAPVLEPAAAADV